MTKHSRISCLFTALLAAAVLGAEPKKSEHAVVFVPAVQDAITGDWQGSDRGIAAQVVPTGGGKYQAVLLSRFDVPDNLIAVLQGTPRGNSVDFNGGGWSGTCDGQHLIARKGAESLDLRHVTRPSPLLNASPPDGAVVLLDGGRLDAWAKKHGKEWLTEDGPAAWKSVGDGAIEVVPGSDCIITRQKFGDCKVHVEFRSLGSPTNSGVFLQTRYEVNINETYGRTDGTANAGFDNCSTAEPLARASRPPLQWQTLDIDFKAPRFDPAGKKTASARATVLLNGVKVYDDQPLDPPHGAAARLGEAPSGPLMLQEHGMPVQFRNVWVLETPK